MQMLRKTMPQDAGRPVNCVGPSGIAHYPMKSRSAFWRPKKMLVVNISQLTKHKENSITKINMDQYNFWSITQLHAKYLIKIGKNFSFV